MHELKAGLLNHISDFMELPKDVMLNMPKITILGNISVFIENHDGIREYTLESVKVDSPIGKIEIMGKHLKIKTVVAEEIIIEGSIHTVVVDGQEG